MTAAPHAPTPREGLDTGSLAELCADGTQVHLEVAQPRPWSRTHHDIAVPDDASTLVRDLDAYGS